MQRKRTLQVQDVYRAKAAITAPMTPQPVTALMSAPEVDLAAPLPEPLAALPEVDEPEDMEPEVPEVPVEPEPMETVLPLPSIAVPLDIMGMTAVPG